MYIILNIVLLVATASLLMKLVTTNHWTTGKKNLVAIIGALTWKIGVELAHLGYLINLPATLVMFIANVPLILSLLAVTLIVHWFND